MNKCPGKTWAEREELILSKSKPLAIQGFSLTEHDDCLEDFIHNFLVRYNSVHGTSTAGDISGIQCHPNRLRSLVDIFLISKYYFPDCTLESVKDALYANSDVLSINVCSTIKRRVYSINRGGARGLGHMEDPDEFGLKVSDLRSK